MKPCLLKGVSAGVKHMVAPDNYLQIWLMLIYLRASSLDSCYGNRFVSLLEYSRLKISEEIGEMSIKLSGNVFKEHPGEEV